jgi:hypothetical protein
MCHAARPLSVAFPLHPVPGPIPPVMFTALPPPPRAPPPAAQQQQRPGRGQRLGLLEPAAPPLLHRHQRGQARLQPPRRRGRARGCAAASRASPASALPSPHPQRT